MSNKKNDESSNEKETSSVLTVRIDKNLDAILEEIKKNKGLTKATVIRNYLELARYAFVDQTSIRSLDDRDMILIKRSTFRKFLETMEEELMMEWGLKFARFINDLARLQGQIENLEYKLDLCEHLGFFTKFIDRENYILFSDKFGPEKFVESFVYKIINYDPKHEYDLSFTAATIESQSKVRSKYNKEIGPETRAKSYYAFKFAKLERE